jgi:xylulose-5-phosphate/fructose-6-phosphate phosphoketolase
VVLLLLVSWWTRRLGPSTNCLITLAWHAAKYIDPAESGAVIPIVHVNGFKISERTIYGCMDDKEMVTLFTGYGYQCRFVEELDDIVS